MFIECIVLSIDRNLFILIMKEDEFNFFVVSWINGIGIFDD